MTDAGGADRKEQESLLSARREVESLLRGASREGGSVLIDDTE